MHCVATLKEWQLAAQGPTSSRVYPWGGTDAPGCRPDLQSARAIPGVRCFSLCRKEGALEDAIGSHDCSWGEACVRVIQQHASRVSFTRIVQQ
jgi:hypothetical protein